MNATENELEKALTELFKAYQKREDARLIDDLETNVLTVYKRFAGDARDVYDDGVFYDVIFQAFLDIRPLNPCDDPNERNARQIAVDACDEIKRCLSYHSRARIDAAFCCN